jgi:hypothetical protein
MNHHVDDILSINVRINQINIATTTIVVILSCINFLFGAIGLLFNVLVFTRPFLRREPCSLYFFSSTCFNLFVIFIIVPVRIVSEGYNLDLANYYLGICKIEMFAFYTTRTISCWSILLACVDRYLHSSTKVRIRRMSSLKTTKRAMVITSAAIVILHIHMVRYYEISNMPDRFGNIAPACYGQKGTYRTFIAFWSMALYSLCPSLLMFIFGCLTLRNLRQHRQVAPTVSKSNQIARPTDTQLLRMLTAQVLVIVISTLPFSIYRLYASFTASMVKDPFRIASENLAFEIAATTSYFAHSTSFYLYTLTGTVFRKELLKTIKQYCHPNRTIL